MSLLGQCQQLPCQPLSVERRLQQLLGDSATSLLIVHLDATLCIIATTARAQSDLTQLRFVWQQISQCPLILLSLEVTREQAESLTISSVAEWVEQLLSDALRQQASDIHIEPQANNVMIRFRVAGQLLNVHHLTTEQGQQVCARLKVLADVDITEHFLPQDGRFSAQLGEFGLRDFRLNCCPVLTGEKLVVRSLGTLTQLPSLNAIGLTEPQRSYTQQALQQQSGLVLVTGPTGSGKTSTLYSMLKHLNHRSMNICTVEDPVEIRFDGVNQVPVSHKRALSFAVILRALLRQDPDVLLIGEIRDSETASIAIQAAQTGHLVLATLHTNGAIESLQRLRSLGVPSDEIRSALSLLISQRLLRKLCPHCHGQDCSHCDDGYLGQVAAFEVLPWHQDLLERNADVHPKVLNEYLVARGLLSLSQHAHSLAQQKLTSFAQAQRLAEFALDEPS